MRLVLALLMLAHGIAHVVGFLGAWAPTRTTILGDRVDLGPSRIRIVGIGWLLLAIAFAVGAVAALLGAGWWVAYALAITGVSFAMCLLQLPETKLGLAINVVLVALLLTAR